MGLADFFNLSKLGTGPDSQTQPDAPGGLAGAIGGDQPMPVQTTGDALQTQAPQQLDGPLQAPISTPPDDGGGVGGFLSRMLQKAAARDPETQMNFWDRLGQFGANMTDLAGDTKGAGSAYRQQMQQREAQAQRQQLNQMAKDLGLTGKEALAFQIDPVKWAGENVKPAPEKGPKVVSTPEGIFAVDDGATDPSGVHTLHTAPAKPPAAPNGYRWNANGVLEPIPGGPADPGVIGNLAGVRRKVVTSNPMPSRARPGAGGWQPPAGFKVLHMPGS